ncbi:RNA polymerase sigma factor [Aquisalinus flavus]|uniref:RNA polymerase sigma factor n=1 Tax=Aquisalinus flavus TaxID=1526572 RepID=UPI00165F1018|nr:sigma-70 family RNA polymerase sigma factor [Aquisalinus flavus]MBD0426605.1 sigma-70 family RNA polymerase sigma factor [Aquisalinus flavus]
MTQTQTDRVYDELLVTLIKAGEAGAAERLAARWQPRLIRVARRLLRDDDQAREAVQEAWTGICRGWHGLSDPAKFPAWAFGILHRKCADRIRHEQRSRARHDSGADPLALPVMAGAEDHAAITQALGMLSPDHRTAAILYFGEGLTLAEIAIATGVPTGTAKSRIFHARQRLKTLLKGD